MSEPTCASADGNDPPHGRDPFAPVEASSRFATPMAVLAFLLAGIALLSGLSPVFGPLGMAVGLVAHVKGSTLGMPSAVVSGIATVAGMAIVLYLR